MTVIKEPTKPTKAVSYYRVSTARQGASGLGLEAQRASVTDYAKANGLAIVAEFTEIETGTRKKKRKEIYKALAAAKACGGVLLIAKLDRLARNVGFISTLMESGAPFVCVDFPQVTNLTLHILAAVAEEEARMISARTKAALKRAKARGTKLGAPQSDASRAQLAEAATISAATKHEDAKDAYALVVGYAKMMRESGLAYAAIAAKLNQEGHRTREGKDFTAMTVWRMLQRASGIARTKTKRNAKAKRKPVNKRSAAVRLTRPQS